MLVKNTMNLAKSLGHQIFTAKYASVDVQDGVLRLEKKPVVSDNYGGLKDVKYVIHDGAVFITGTRSRWYYLAWGTPLTFNYGHYKMSEERFNQLIVPEECVIRNKRWGLFRRKHKIVIDTNKNPYEYWLERKESDEFNMAMHPYKIME